MSLKTYLSVSSAIFSFVALGHLLRVLFCWELIIADYSVPNWMSILAFLLLSFLSLQAMRLKKSL